MGKGGKGDTLRSRRASAPGSSRQSADLKKEPKQLSVKEQIARRAAKPVIAGRQFKWVSGADKLAKASVDLSRVRERREQLEDEKDGEGDEQHSLFGHAVEASGLVNLSAPFVRWQRRVEPWSRSLVLVLHHRKDIVEATCEALAGKLEEVELAGETILDTIPSLLTDLSTHLLPELPALLKALINLTHPSPFHASSPQLLQKVYDVLGALFRDLGRGIVADESTRADVWAVVRRGLGAPAEKEQEEAFTEIVVDEDAMAVEEQDEDAESDTDELDLGAPVASTSAAPATAPESVTKTLAIRPHFRTTSPLRRLLASSFAYLVRKTKSSEASDDLRSLFTLILADLDAVAVAEAGESEKKRGKKPKKGKSSQEDGNARAFAEGCVWLVVEACSGQSKGLHSRTSVILSSVFAAVPSAGQELTRGVYPTALVGLGNAVTKAEDFSVVVEEVLNVLQASVKAKDGERAEAALAALEVVASVKNGMLITPTLKPRVLSSLNHLATLLQGSGNHATAVIKAALALFPLTQLADSLSGPVKAFVSTVLSPAVWNAHKGEVAALAAGLLQIEWAAFDHAVLPALLKLLTQDGRKDGGKGTELALLERLAGAGKLGAKQAGTEWQAWARKSCEDLVDQGIQDLKARLELDADLFRALRVLRFVPASKEKLQLLLEALLVGQTVATESFQQGVLNVPSLLAELLELLGATDGKVTRTWVLEHLQELVQQSGWHRSVLSALASVVSSTAVAALDLSQVKGELSDIVLSEDGALRLAALKLLRAAYEPKTPARELIEKAIEVEEIPLSVEGAREKSVKLKRVGMLLASRMSDAQGNAGEVFEIVVKYTLAMLKVNFRPLWAEAISSLQLLCAQHAEAVWPLVREQLLLVTTRGERLYVAPTVDTWVIPSSKEGAVRISEELKLRCPRREALLESLRPAMELSEGKGDEDYLSSAAEAQRSEAKLVTNHYETQLLLFATEIPNVAQKHSRDFVGVFLSCFRDHDSAAEVDESSRERKIRLVAWLALFGKFSGPKSLHRTDELAGFFRALTAYPDADVQGAALQCLLRWKSAPLVANAERLKNLLEPTKLRDELLSFISSQEAGGVNPAHRPEVVPLVVRLSFGLMTSRHGRTSGSSGQGKAGRRAAILGALRTCSPAELSLLVDLAIAPFRAEVDAAKGRGEVLFSKPPQVSAKRQLGFVGFVADMVKHLGRELVDRWDDLIIVTLNICHFAQLGLDKAAEAELAEEELDEQEELEGEEDEEDQGQAMPYRRLRQLSLRRLDDFFRLDVDVEFDFTPFLRVAFPHVVSPRLQKLGPESAQGPSSLTELFVTWSTRRDTMPFLVDFDGHVLPALYSCFAVKNAKSSILGRIIDLVKNLIDFTNEDGGPGSASDEKFLRPAMDPLLDGVRQFFVVNKLLADPKQQTGQRVVRLLCALAPYITSQKQSEEFLNLLFPLLAKRQTPEKVRLDIMEVVAALIPIAGLPSTSPTFVSAYDIISHRFTNTATRAGRLRLLAAFQSLTASDTELTRVAGLLADLNSFSKTRSEEPDFDRRLAAFSSLNEKLYTELSPREWLAVMDNMLFFILDEEELALRSNASFALRRFIQAAADEASAGKLDELVAGRLLPGLRQAMRSKADLIRGEVLGVYAVAVEKLDRLSELKQLTGLLVGGDQEASVFNNLYHIQVHRRTRALRRLGDEAETGAISVKTTLEFVLPLLDPLISNADTTNPEVVTEAITCTSRVAKRLPWSAYNRLVNRHVKLAKTSVNAQKACIRALVAVLKAFHQDLSTDARISDLVSERLVPGLLKFLQSKENVDSELRIPVAEGIAVVLQHLPDASKTAAQSALLTSLAEIMRSTHQDTRDLARTAICNIMVVMGPSAFPLAVKELRQGLQRGPQLHVLAFTVHALLLRVASDFPDADLEAALEDLVPILDDDIFGTPNKDRQSQEFKAKTKFREVKTFKSLDSFQLLAQHMSPASLPIILSPLRNTLHRLDSAKVLASAAEVLRRVAAGLIVNTKLSPDALLELAYDLISDNAKFLKPRAARKRKGAIGDFEVQLDPRRLAEVDMWSKNAYHFVIFGFELFNSAFRKSHFNLDQPSTIARLETLMSAVANTLISNNEDVLGRALKATASLIRCSLDSVGKTGPILVRQLIDIIDSSGGFDSELSQSAVRTLTTVIRDCKGETLSERQLTILLQLIGPDLEESDKQGILFALLRGIMSRKFVAPEIYDLMDKVAEMLVTNQSTQVREVCRAIYLQFLLDYPQGRGRLKTSLSFLAKNFSYEHESGRVSAMEIASAVISKFASDLLADTVDLFFVSIALVLTNDESTKCREMAAELVKKLFLRLDEKKSRETTAMLRSWLSQDDKTALKRMALQVYSAAVEVPGVVDSAGQEELLRLILPILAEGSIVTKDDADSSETDEWQLHHQALRCISKVYGQNSARLTSVKKLDSQIWREVQVQLVFPHAWVRSMASRLLGNLYSSNTALDKTYPEGHPLSNPQLLDAAQKFCQQLKSPTLDDALALQIVKNLFYACKCFHARLGDKVVGAVEVQDEDEQPELEDAAEEQNPLRWLLSRLSYQAISAHRNRPGAYLSSTVAWARQPSSILQCFAGAVSIMTPQQIAGFTTQLVTPICRIIEDPNAQDPQMKDLQALAHELQTAMEARMGTTEYTQAYNAVRQKQVDRRNARKAEIALQALNDPEQDAQRKIQRNSQKKRQVKKRAAHFAGTKGVAEGKRVRRS